VQVARRERLLSVLSVGIRDSGSFDASWSVLILIVCENIERYTALCQHALNLIEEVVDQFLGIPEAVRPAGIRRGSVPMIRYHCRSPSNADRMSVVEANESFAAGACRVSEYLRPCGLTLVGLTRRISNFAK
jgi:hypothetical protein